MRLYLLRIYFYFFERTDLLKSCIKQPQSYLKTQEIEIKFNLKILFYAAFVGELQKLYGYNKGLFLPSSYFVLDYDFE